MNRLRYIVLLSLFIYNILPGIVVAGALAEDYNEQILQRQELENRRRDYENRLTALASQNKNLTMVFYQCISRKEKDLWEARLDKSAKAKEQMETHRLAIAEIRKRLGDIRQQLEQKRLDIESAYTDKGPGSEYETAFRAYMKELDETYFQALSGELFREYDVYFSEMEAHIAFLKECVGQCMKRKLK